LSVFVYDDLKISLFIDMLYNNCNYKYIGYSEYTQTYMYIYIYIGTIRGECNDIYHGLGGEKICPPNRLVLNTTEM